MALIKVTRLNRVTKLSSKVKEDALYFRGIIWHHTTFPGEIKAFKRKLNLQRASEEQ